MGRTNMCSIRRQGTRGKQLVPVLQTIAQLMIVMEFHTLRVTQDVKAYPQMNKTPTISIGGLGLGSS